MCATYYLTTSNTNSHQEDDLRKGGKESPHNQEFARGKHGCPKRKNVSLPPWSGKMEKEEVTQAPLLLFKGFKTPTTVIATISRRIMMAMHIHFRELF